MAWSLIGSLYNDAHHATPIVAGDWAAFRTGWDGETMIDDEVGALDGARFVQPHLELRAPAILADDAGQVMLVVEIHRSDLADSYLSFEQLVEIARFAPTEVQARQVIDVGSRQLALMLAYLTEDELADADWVEVGAPSLEAPVLFTMRTTATVYEVIRYAPSACGLDVPIWAGKPDRCAFMRVLLRPVTDA